MVMVVLAAIALGASVRGAGAVAQARDAAGPAGGAARPGLPGKNPQRPGVLVERPRRRGLPRQHGGAGGHGFSGQRQHAHPRPLRRSGPTRHGVHHVAGPPRWSNHKQCRVRRPVDVLPRFLAAVPRLRLRHGQRRPHARAAAKSDRRRDRPDLSRPEPTGRLDLHPRHRRRGLRHGHADAGAALAPRTLGSRSPRAPSAAAVHYLEMCKTADGRHPLLVQLRARITPAHLRRGHRHALQRRGVRLAAGQRLPQVRHRPVQGPGQPVEQGRRPRLLHPPLRIPGPLPGRRQILGRLFSQHPRPTPATPKPAGWLVARRQRRTGLRHEHRHDHPATAVQVPCRFHIRR